MLDPTTARIQAVFAATFRPLPDAARIVRRLRGRSLDEAIAAAANDDSDAALAELLACRAALLEEAEPRRLADRLEAEADALDARCARHDAQAAEDFGKAAYRRGRGDEDLAAAFTRRAVASERAADGLREASLHNRLRAARVKARLAAAQAVAAVGLPRGA